MGICIEVHILNKNIFIKRRNKDMTKNELVKTLATKCGYTQKDVKAVLDAAQEIVYNAMAKEEEVKLFDGLTLSGVRKPACVKRNPLTGENVNVPEKVAPKAKFGKAAKDAVNGEI